MTRMPSIVGIAVNLQTDQITSFVGDLNAVRKWATELPGSYANVQIREIGEIIMFLKETS